MNDEIKWTPDSMLEVTIKQPDDFLKVRETLTRIGVASRKERKIYQSCHILHKQGRYFIVHFKELFALDGKQSSISVNDIERRNTISQLLADWGLVELINPVENKAPLSQIKVLNDLAIENIYPDITFILDINVNTSLSRRLTKSKDRMEQVNENFLIKVRKAYLKIADDDKKRCIVVDCNNKSIIDINNELVSFMNLRYEGIVQ